MMEDYLRKEIIRGETQSGRLDDKKGKRKLGIFNTKKLPVVTSGDLTRRRAGRGEKWQIRKKEGNKRKLTNQETTIGFHLHL